MRSTKTETVAPVAAEFTPTHGGVYQVDNGVVTVLVGGPAQDTPAIEATTQTEQTKEGAA